MNHTIKRSMVSKKLLLVSIFADHDQLALVDEAEHSIIELAQLSQSLENGQSVFTGRGSYVLLSIDSESVHCNTLVHVYA